MVKRRQPVPWEPADKARALVLLRENGGALRATARQWNEQSEVRRLNEATLRLWRDNPVEQSAPLVLDAKRERVVVLKSILRRLEQGFDAALEAQPGIVSLLARKQPSALATTIGILTDKVRLLEGEATDITEQKVVYIEPGSLRRMALTVIDGGREEAS